jgi:nitrate reductase delta subunit
MTITFRALAALLAYPDDGLVAALPEIRAVVEAEPRLGKKEKAALGALVDEIGAGDPLDAQERYVEMFYRGRSTSLHLFEHVHGDSRDRGTAMLDLKGIYERAGLALTANELPDYLPAVLEFLSTQPPATAEEMLGDCAHILRALGETLQERASPYAAVFAALLAMVRQPGLAAVKERAPARKERSIDEEWVEEPVIFGPAGAPGACGSTPPQTSVVHFMPRPGMPR